MGALCFFLKCLPLAGRDTVGQWLVYLSLALFGKGFNIPDRFH